MALKIRLARGGAKKRPYYSIVVADVRAPRDGRFIEKVGTYNPLLAKDDENRVQINAERAKHWLGVGAKPSDRVARFLNAIDLVEWKAGDNPKKAEPGEKAKQRAEEKAEKEAAAKAAAEEAAAAPAEEAASDAPAEGSEDNAGEDAEKTDA